MADTKLIAHACRNTTPSGSFRASIGYAEEGKACFSCGVVIESKHEIKFDNRKDGSESS